MKKTSLLRIAVASVAVVLTLPCARCSRGPDEAGPHDGWTPEAAGEADALAEARKAVLAGDQLKCIEILEKAKLTATTLKLLASCYKMSGDMEKYYKTIERYVSKYPAAPDVEKYRSILVDAGKL
jgi:hypothetical protein